MSSPGAGRGEISLSKVKAILKGEKFRLMEGKLRTHTASLRPQVTFLPMVTQVCCYFSVNRAVNIRIQKVQKIMLLQETEGTALNQIRITIPPPLNPPVSSLMEGT